MSRDLSLLDPGFRRILDAVVGELAEEGISMLVYCTARDPWEQARLWRRSRTTARVRQEVARLQDGGAPWLAQVIEGVGPQTAGPWATNAGPGLSWHQWGLAVDAVPMVAGSPKWDARHPHWARWASACTAHGLTSGSTFGDWPHVQLPPESSPRKRYQLPYINDAMRQRWLTK